MKLLLIVVSLISFFTKVILHIHLDSKHNRFKGFYPSGMQPLEYFFFYIEDVRKEYLITKRICNISYLVFWSDFLLIVIFKYFN